MGIADNGIVQSRMEKLVVMHLLGLDGERETVADGVRCASRNK